MGLAVSPFGWSLTIGQLKILRELAKVVIFLPDTDKRSDALTAAGLISTQMWCRMPRMPKGVDDPEHLTLEQLRALT